MEDRDLAVALSYDPDRAEVPRVVAKVRAAPRALQETGALSPEEARAARELECGMAAALDLLGRARRALAQGELPELGRLAALLESLRRHLDRLASADRRRRQGLLALIDEAGVLAEKLRDERTRLARRLRAGGVHRRAGAAYRRAGKL